MRQEIVLKHEITVEAKINDKSFSLIVDTGTDFIALTKLDITELKLESLGTWKVRTAIGIVPQDIYWAWFQYNGYRFPTPVQQSEVRALGTIPLEIMKLKVNPAEGKLEQRGAEMEQKIISTLEDFVLYLSNALKAVHRLKTLDMQSDEAMDIINEYLPRNRVVIKAPSKIAGKRVIYGEMAQDPLLSTIASQICSTGACLAENPEKLPICSKTEAKKLERCIVKVKARNVKAGYHAEGKGTKEAPNPFAVCRASLKCRLGGAKE